MITIDFNDLNNKSKQEIQNILKNLLNFGDDYGCNLDAFIDYLTCLTDTTIELLNVDQIKDDYVLEVYDCILISMRENSDLKVLNILK